MNEELMNGWEGQKLSPFEYEEQEQKKVHSHRLIPPIPSVPSNIIRDA